VFAFQETRTPVAVAFTDRHGGMSRGPYASLNLAARGEDHPDVVAENLSRVGRAFAYGAEAAHDQSLNPPPVVALHQVHGADVHVVGPEHLNTAARQEPLVGDAMVTDVPGVVLIVRVADCVPVLLADVDRGVVGAAHAGRPGMVAGVVPSTVKAMRELGAESVVAWVGPHVCGRCYEVPESMRAEIAQVVPASYAETSWGTPAVDVGAGVRAQLVAEGAELVDAARCTMEDDDLFSYRRQGKDSGRMAGLVWVRP
jgi:YfiH family protein